MADVDLPVFSFRPNWKEGVDETLSFLTDVLRSKTGAEQRRQLRSTPRRIINADFLLIGAERTYWDLFINRLGGQEMTIPLYWDIVTLTSAVVAGFTDRIDFDTTYREFQAGDLAILIQKDARFFETVEISAVDGTGIDLVAPVASTWPAGTTLMPLRRGLIDDYGELNHKSAKVATISVRLALTAPNPWTPDVDPATVYASLPVFSEEPNWADDVTVQHTRDTVKLDNQVGIPYQVDLLSRSLVGQSHRWFMNGRDKLGLFRDLLYRRAGRVGSFWLPTFKADLTLVSDALSTATQITVENVGLNYTEAPTEGREYIAIRHSAGTIYRKITSVLPGLTSTTERVNLDAQLGLALSPGQVRKISFMDTARFDQDDFQITHHNGIDGLHECSAGFRTFRNIRTFPTPIDYPIEESEMSGVACGVDADYACYTLAPYEGWEWEWVWTTTRAAGGSPPPDWLFCTLTYPSGGNYASNSGGANPGGPKVSFSQYKEGDTAYQVLRMLNVPGPGSYFVIMDPPNLYPSCHFYLTGRYYQDPLPTVYKDLGTHSGGAARSGSFDIV